jgi:ubiquitin-like modifier-activating enzyme ATG7
MTIPMPGHTVDKKNKIVLEATRNDVRILDELIENNDIIFLLGDSKEVRWLPTVIAQAKNKLVLNAGLGFDSYVVMRHGMRGGEGKRLSCYFCSDVNAPKDSISDRTLDQACTVTRPGISMIASALAVELLISILHHPKRGLAPAESAETQSTSLGSVPQQIRGFLSQWKSLIVSGECYDKCTACSDPIVDAYKKDGFEFVLKVLNNPEVLEEMTGISQEKAQETEWDFTAEDDF